MKSLLVVFKGRVLIPGIVPNIYSAKSIRLWIRERQFAYENGVIDSLFRGAYYPEVFTSSFARWNKYVFSQLPNCKISIALHSPPVSRVSRIEIQNTFRPYNISMMIWKKARNQWDRVFQSLEFLKNQNFDTVLISRLDLAPRNFIPIPLHNNTVMFPFYDKKWLCDSIILVPGNCVSKFSKIMQNMSYSNDPMIAHTSLHDTLRLFQIEVDVWLPQKNYTCGTGSIFTVENPMYELLGRNTFTTRLTIVTLSMSCIFCILCFGLILFLHFTKRHKRNVMTHKR